MRITAIGIAFGTTLAVAGCSAPAPQPTVETAAPAPVPAAPSYTPVVSLNDLMVNVVDSHSHEIWDAEDKGPVTKADWERLEHAAVVLATSGGLTAVSGNGPNDQRWTGQADWVKHSEALSTAGLATIQAVRGQDVAALRKAGDALVLTCIDCHREYKLEVPKIWSDHEGVH